LEDKRERFEEALQRLMKKARDTATIAVNRTALSAPQAEADPATIAEEALRSAPWTASNE
jgi:hypothetical protein